MGGFNPYSVYDDPLSYYNPSFSHSAYPVSGELGDTLEYPRPPTVRKQTKNLGRSHLHSDQVSKEHSSPTQSKADEQQPQSDADRSQQLTKEKLLQVQDSPIASPTQPSPTVKMVSAESGLQSL